MSRQSTVRDVLNEIGSAAGKFLVAFSILICWSLVGAGVFAVIKLIPVFLKDLELSVTPLLRIRVNTALAWFLSIMSTVSELQLAFMNKALLQAFKEQIPETLLPFIEQRQMKYLFWFNIVMLVYDVVTNFAGAFEETYQENMLHHFVAMVIEVLGLTLSEFFLVAMVALTISLLAISLRVTRLLAPLFSSARNTESAEE